MRRYSDMLLSALLVSVRSVISRHFQGDKLVGRILSFYSCLLVISLFLALLGYSVRGRGEISFIQYNIGKRQEV